MMQLALCRNIYFILGIVDCSVLAHTDILFATQTLIVGIERT
jgi:hypothetical protein